MGMVTLEDLFVTHLCGIAESWNIPIKNTSGTFHVFWTIKFEVTNDCSLIRLFKGSNAFEGILD